MSHTLKAFLLLAALVGGCLDRPEPTSRLPFAGESLPPPQLVFATTTPGATPPPATTSSVPVTPVVNATHSSSVSNNTLGGIPTPDSTRPGVVPGLGPLTYTVQTTDSLSGIAMQFGASLDSLLEANRLGSASDLQPGQMLLIPVITSYVGPGFKIVPDSELVHGPASVGFDLSGFVKERGGYLAHYTEEIEGKWQSGASLVEIVAARYSINPRLLLALLEYQSEWVTNPAPAEYHSTYPLGRGEGGTEGLFLQLVWTANALNQGFYSWRNGQLSALLLGGGTRVAMEPGINAGTAAVQFFFAQVSVAPDWQQAVGPTGVYETYQTLFGDPFARAVEPLLPDDLAQPALALPWASDETWYFTGGPHPGWGTGSAWGALDFSPPTGRAGCEPTAYRVRAAAPGIVTYSDFGIVIEDLDGDGYEQTGWVLIYAHIASPFRVSAGTRLQTGDPIGRPSCEGGEATATHLHFARRFNGVWLAAAGDIPFVVGGWRAQTNGRLYDGTLVKGNEVRVSASYEKPDNAIGWGP